MVKNTTEYLQVGITPELKEKVNKYCSVKGNTKNKLINDLLQDFFNNKVVSNDFIKLDKPLYFNIQDLLNNKSVICTTTKPTSKFNEFIKIVNVPNNLDSYNKNYNCYCSDAPETHKGIIINSLLDANHINLFIHYLLFEYTAPTNEQIVNISLIDEPILKISLINENDLLSVLNMDKHKDLLKEFKEKENELKEAIKKDKAAFIITENDLNEMELTPEKEIENNYNFALFKTEETDNNIKVFPILLIDKNNNILYGNKLIKTHENYFYLRPFYLDVFINNLMYLMENNTEINKHIQEYYKINIKDLKEFQNDYKFNTRIYNLINVLKPSNTNHININVLFDSHINNIDLEKAIFNFYKNVDLDKNTHGVFKVDL